MIELPKVESLENKLFKEIIGKETARVFLKTDSYSPDSLLRKFDLDNYNLIIVQPKPHYENFDRKLDGLDRNLRENIKTLLYIDEIFKIILPHYKELLKNVWKHCHDHNLVVIAVSNKVEFDYCARYYGDFQREFSLFNICYEVD